MDRNAIFSANKIKNDNEKKTSGFSGFSGFSGSKGFSGFSGAQGPQGISGYSGIAPTGTIIRAYRDIITQSIPNNSWTKIKFNAINFDLLSEFDNINNYRFTATMPGYYQINARIYFEFHHSSSNDYCSIAIYKNGYVYSCGNNLQIHISSSQSTLNNNAPNVSDIVQLNINDYIEVYCFQNSGSPHTINIGSEQTFVSIAKH